MKIKSEKSIDEDVLKSEIAEGLANYLSLGTPTDFLPFVDDNMVDSVVSEMSEAQTHCVASIGESFRKGGFAHIADFNKFKTDILLRERTMCVLWFSKNGFKAEERNGEVYLCVNKVMEVAVHPYEVSQRAEAYLSTLSA